MSGLSSSGAGAGGAFLLLLAEGWMAGGFASSLGGEGCGESLEALVTLRVARLVLVGWVGFATVACLGVGLVGGGWGSSSWLVACFLEKDDKKEDMVEVDEKDGCP